MAETLTAGEALIALRATSDKLSADMAAASSKITSELQKIEKSAASIDFGKVFEGGLKAAGAFAGGIAAVGTAATALALQSVKTGDEINRMSQAFGISAEELSGLKMAAEDVDVSFSQVQVGLKTLANQAADAAAGNEAAARTFEALGIAVTDANGNLRPTGDLLADVADKMAGMQDGAGKTAIATQLLGRSGQDLIPVLNGGSAALRQAAEEAKGLGVAFDTEAAAAAAALDDQLDKLGHQIGGVANEIGQSLMPIVSEVVGEVSGWIAENRTLMSQSVQQWVTGVKVVIEGMLPIVQGAAKAFNDLGEAIFGASSATGIAGLTSQIQKTEAAMQDLVSDNKFWWLQSEATTKASEEYKHLELTLASLQQQLAHAKGEAVAGAKAFDQLAGDTDKAAGSAGDAGNNFGKLPPPIIKTGDAAKKTADANKQLQASIDKLKLDAISDDLDQATKAMERSATVVKDGDYLRALEDIQNAYEAQVEAAKKAADEAVQAGADKARAAEMEALAVDQAQRDMAAAVEKLNEPLQKNAEYWDGVGEVIADLPPEVRAFIPTLDDAALALGHVGEAAKEMGENLVKLEGISSDLAKGLAQTITGSADWRGVGDAIIAQTLDATFTQGLEKALNDTFIKSLKEITDPVSKAMEEMFKSAFSFVADGMKALMKPAIDALGGALSEGISAIGASAGVVGAIVAGVAGIGVGIAAAFGAFDGPDMQHKISRVIAKLLKKSLGSPEVHDAIDEALKGMGFEFTTGIERIFTQTPISGAEVRAVWAEGGAAAGQAYSEGFQKFLASEGNGINNLAASDLINLYFPGLDAAGEAAATEAAKAAGAAAAALQGLTGPEALVFAEQFGASLANVAHVLGMTEDEFLSFVQSVAGEGAAAFAAGLDKLNGAAIDALGDSGFQGLLSDVEKHMETVFGVKNIDASNLLDVFIQSGASAEAFAAQLERMADSDPALRRLIDSMDPPLVDALAAVEDGGNAAAKAIGKLTGQANTSLAGAEARILAFGDALFQVAEDGSKQLNTLGEELNSELQAGISGIEDAIKEEVNSAAGLTSETLGKAFSELQSLAAMPAEALDDSTTQAIEHLKAVIQAATGWTAEQVDQMIATATAVPPPVQPVPPETTASLDGAADATGQIADNSEAAATAADDLTASTQATGAAAGDTAAAFEALATRALTALNGLIGTVDDDAGILSVEDIIARRIPEALVQAQDATLGATGVMKDSFDYARGAVLQLTQAINEIPRDITTTVHIVQDGSTQITPTPEQLPGGASGGWVPGSVGEPFPMVAHGGEFILPADIAQRVIGGGAMPSNATTSFGAPSATQSAPADPDYALIPVRKRDLIEGAVLEVARATQTGRAHVEGRQIHVSPTYGRRR